MRILSEDTVVISEPKKAGEFTVITVNCPDRTGLGCDLCRIILLFGLTISRGDASTDGKWCYLVFWVVEKPTTRWNLLKKRLLEVCPSYFSMSGINYYQWENQNPKPPSIFLLKFWCSCDRKDLLHAVTKVLCNLELRIMRVQVSTTPDGRLMDLFYVTDTREQLHTKERQEETIHSLKTVLGRTLMSCQIELASKKMTAYLRDSSFFPSAVADDVFGFEAPKEFPQGSLAPNSVSVSMDNTLSPSHTLVQIVCRHHKGVIYDIMRILKDHNIQISYGRFFSKLKGIFEVDLFIVQADGKKLSDPSRRTALCSCLEMELSHPLRVATIARGPDTELLVANPVELSGTGRPLVFHDITLALNSLDIQIFSVKIGRHVIRDREWEVYMILLDEGNGIPVSRVKIEEGVRKVLMGWE